MVSRRLLFTLGAMCVLALLAAPVAAEVLTGNNIAFVKSFTVGSSAGLGVVAGVSFDPTYTNGDGNYDRVYMVERDTAANGAGLYSAILSTESVSGQLALASLDSPYDSVVDASGNVYVCYTGTQAIYKVTDPQATATQTRMLGNYGFNTSGSPSDDDPVSIDMMPAGFGLAGYGEGDLLLLDNGIDWNEREGLSAVSKDSLSTAQIYQNIWNDGDEPGGDNNDMRGKVSVVDNKFYFSRMTIPTVDVGGTSYPAIYRVGADGVLETIGLSLPDGETLVNLDDAVAVNPADGSVWLIKYDADNRRVVFRADVAAATDEGGGVYLADATTEITWAAEDGFNCGVNDMAWSPDGKTLVIGNPSLTDSLHVFTAVPEPGTCMLIGVGLMSLAMIRRRK